MRNLFSLTRPALGTLAVALLLAGCSLAPTYQRPDAPIPGQWSDGTGTSQHSAAASAATTLNWQAFVTDKTLRGLIKVALANNRDLRQTLNHPGNRGGCLVKVKLPRQRALRVLDNTVVQPQPVECPRWIPAAADD